MNAATNKGKTALHFATYCKNVATVRFLLNQAETDVRVKQKHGCTAFHLPENKGQLEIVELLIQHKDGATLVESKQNDEWTALHIVTCHNNLDIVRFLIEMAGADVNATARDGCTALHFACVKGHFRMVQYSSKCKGINMEAQEVNG